MAVVNFSLATGPVTPAFVVSSPVPLRLGLDDLLYTPAEQQEYESENSGLEPFSPPVNHPQQRRFKVRKRAGSTYLPPPNQYTQYPHNNVPQNPYHGQLHTQVYQQNSRLDIHIENQRVREINPNTQQYDSEGQYVHDPTGDYDYDQKRIAEQSGAQRPPYNPGYADLPYAPVTPPSTASSHRFESRFNQNNYNFGPSTTPSPLPRQHNDAEKKTGSAVKGNNGQPPDRPPGFVKVETGSSGGKTRLHAVLDYDDDYYEGESAGSDGSEPRVTPLQGPILLRNGSVPVVPLTSYPTVNNGTFYQIPILWTALSVALGYELQGQIIKGTPCIKRNYQLYCPTAGNAYPLDKIETFIDENKALIKRMYGSFNMPSGGRVRRAPGVPDVHLGDSYFRHARQTVNAPLPNADSVNNTGRVDACESKTEIMTPYWALNSAKKLRAIVNTMHFEQAIHQEVCSKKSTSRCSGDCGCEQKYKWHRLLAYDPSDDCAGIFMDWFLFPSCCVCRCKP